MNAAPLPHKSVFVTVTEDQLQHWEVHAGTRIPSAVPGKCPACSGDCHIKIHGEAVWGATPSAAPTGHPPRIPRLLECNCLDDHDQPEGVQAGCGRFWLVALVHEGDGRYRIVPETDLGLLRPAKAFAEAVRAQETSIQKAAEKWLGGVTALYGIFSLAGLTAGRQAVATLQASGKVAVAVVFGLAVVAAAVALVAGYLAAYGWPRRADTMSPEALRGWDDERDARVLTAASRLRTAVLGALASLGLLVVALILTWFLPAAV